MELHKIIDVNDDDGNFICKKMRVESGYMYRIGNILTAIVCDHCNKVVDNLMDN